MIVRSLKVGLAHMEGILLILGILKKQPLF